ncbi:MAG: flagellar hook-associated protein FlgK [Gemmatimonadaceae bacterium]
MSTFGNILSVARTAISAQQAAMQVISHNIANAQTDGYSRQRVEMQPNYPLVLPFGSLGTGVSISDVTRGRDALLDGSFRRDTAATEGYGMQHDLLGEIESILHEPSDGALASSLDAFWNAWSDLSNNPGNPVQQNVVRQRGSQLAYMFNNYTTRLNELVSRTRDRLTQAVGEVNSLASRIATLNGEINAAESRGNQAPDLRDARDKLADEMAKLGVSRAEPQADGTLSIYIGGMAIVSGNQAQTVEIRGGSTVALAIVGDADTLQNVSGPLGSMVDFINTDAAGVQSRLDDLARGLVNGVNEYHAAGWTAAGDALGNANWNPANGPTGSRVNFFDAASLTAGTIRLSDEVLADASVIASGDVQNSPGLNNIAIAIGTLRDDTGMDALRTRMGANFATQIGFAAGTTYADHYQQTVSDLGVQVADADRQHTVFDTLATQSDHRRTAVSGVSIDEELTRLMQYQQVRGRHTRRDGGRSDDAVADLDGVAHADSQPPTWRRNRDRGRIRVVVLACDRRGVRLGIEAPSHVSIVREEIVAQIAAENRRAGAPSHAPDWLGVAKRDVDRA